MEILGREPNPIKGACKMATWHYSGGTMALVALNSSFDFLHELF